MRAGFETYRAFTQDANDLSAAVKSRGKLNLPVLLLAGEASTFIPVSQAQCHCPVVLIISLWRL
jgi:hypothetical protein